MSAAMNFIIFPYPGKMAHNGKQDRLITHSNCFTHQYVQIATNDNTDYCIPWDTFGMLQTQDPSESYLIRLPGPGNTWQP